MQKKYVLNALPFLLLGALYIVLQPRLSVLFFPAKRHQMLLNFSTTSVANNKIEPRQLWQLREFYYPGSFDFSREKRSKLNFAYFIRSKQTLPFLIFRSNKVRSEEALTNSQALFMKLRPQKIACPVVLKTVNDFICVNQNEMIVISLRKTKAMVTFNGFFDYLGQDKALIGSYRYWISKTIFYKS